MSLFSLEHLLLLAQAPGSHRRQGRSVWSLSGFLCPRAPASPYLARGGAWYVWCISHLLKSFCHLLDLPPQQPHCLASSLALSPLVPVSSPKSALLWRTCDSRAGHFPSTRFLSTLFDFFRARGSEPADPLFSGLPLRWGLSPHGSSLPSRCRVYPGGEGALETADMGVHFLLTVPLSCWAGGRVGL